MAHVKANYNKEGEIISYRFFASIQNEQTGKNELVTKTVKPIDGLTPAKELKKMQNDADKWEEAVKKGNAPSKNQTFKHFIENEFIPVHVCNGKHSPSTVNFYKNITAKLIEHFGRKPLNSIRAIDIERYLIDLSRQEYSRGKDGTKQTYSASYVNQSRKVLAVAFNFAERHGMIEKNPTKYINSVKKERKEVDFLTESETKQFLSCLNADASLYWKTAMNVLIRCGLRRGELCGLKWEDIDFANDTITIRRNVINNTETGRKNFVKDTKSATSDRIITIDPYLAKLLKDWKSEQSNLFGAKLMPSAYVFGIVSVSHCKVDKQINREELYEMIWSKPVSQVAKEFNISDVALRKRCIRLNIPMPERGYWSKHSYGSTEDRPELPDYDESYNTADPYSPVRPDTITTWLARFNKTHGLRNVSPHDLRHTCATLLLSSGANIKETQTILGHADASTTLRFYVGTDLNSLKAATDRLAQALAMGE